MDIFISILAMIRRFERFRRRDLTPPSKRTRRKRRAVHGERKVPEFLVAKPKRKLTRKEKAERAARRATFMTIFVNGKQKQVRRQSISDGISQEEFIERNADPIWLHQNEMWEYIKPEPPLEERCESVPDVPPRDDETPF